ncbi:S-layer family protein [Agathobaculum butyriciproducens]|uniref:S-layer homology domain-containing protein n=1 Tax=Agathobaculum butyriciproducens TaxID=1628085 RepID=UPI000D5CDBE9|nr:S-layer family protein [Agathobaculum butyriciproducens]
MKRRLLSAFLAVMMVLTMAPVAFAAEEAGNGDTLKKLFTDVKAGESGSGNVTVTIDKDYNLTGYNWTALTVDGYNGAGIVTVEGNNHTITGLNTSLFAGGFAGTSGIVIKDLTLDNVSIEDTTNEQGIGAFINNVDSMPKIELNNCHLTDSTITSTGGARVGGLIGWTSGYNKKNDGPVDTYITVTNCSVENTNITAEGSVGGIIGHAGANPATFHTFENNTITNCTLNSTDNGDWRVGVVVGTANVGEVALNNTTESGNTVTQTGKTAPAGQSNLYGRFVPGTTGKLVIDGTAVFDSSIVAVVDNKGYKTLADAVAAAQGGATVKLLKDVTEDVVIPADKTITLDLNGKKLTNIRDNTITNHGKIEIIDKTGKGVVDNITNAKTAITNDGTVVLRGGTYTRSQEAGKDKDNGGGNSYYTILNDNGGSLTIYDGVTVYNKGHFSSMIRNGGTAGAESKLYINGGTFSGGINTVKNDESGYLNISGGDFSNTTQFVVMNWHKAEISGDATFAVNDTAEAVLFTSSYGGAATTKGELTISGGYFKTATDTQDMIRDAYDANNKGTAYVSGGYFNKRFSGDFCATGLTVIDNDDKIYKYTVGTVEVKDENEIKTGTQEGDTQADVSAIAADKQDAAREVGESVTPTKLADTTPITPDDKAQALTELVKKNKVTLDTNGKIPENTTVTVVKETYLDVTVTGYDTANSTVSMDIAPKYNLIAVAKTGDNQTAQVTLKSAQDAKVGSTEVEVTLPEAFKGKKVYINHNNGANLYVATADKTTGKVKFTTNGFSPFTFALTNPDVVAEVNGNAYKTLQEAANAAKDGDEITVIQNKNLDLTFTTTKSVKVTNKTNDKITVKFNGTNKDVAKDATETFSYTKSSSGSSSSGKTTYKVTTSAVNNGGVNASPSSAEKGATITITLSPDKGYKLDKLTVTDGSGKTVSTVKKSDTVYTFTMPASAVKVGVSYVKATETPSKTKFNDVSANDWFASAVDYVTGKGMMNGTADNTFSPKANTTRGMVVTVLYRLENQPSTSAASFTDVASGAYYANAVAWANANGIVSGYGSGKFGPNDKVTREQLAAILYRYAQYKKYDVSVGEDTNILSYDDAQSISTYAIPAIQWACGAGVVTGKFGSKLDPKGNATRAEVAAMLMRFCENVK